MEKELLICAFVMHKTEVILKAMPILVLLVRNAGGGVPLPHALPLAGADDEGGGSTSPDGVGSGYTTPRSGAALATAARRKTDLIPTMPSPREGPPSTRQSRRTSGNTPNRAYSMSRLDQLSQPRKILPRPGTAGSGSTSASAPERPPRAGQSRFGSKGTLTLGLSSAKSMGHLACAGSGRLSAAAGNSGSQTLARSDTSRSMTQLCVSSPVPPPRMTRAERLRRRAREQAAKSQPIDSQASAMPAQLQGE